MARKPNIALVILSLLLLVTLTGFLRLGSLMVRDFGFLSSRVSGPQKDFDLDFQRTSDVSKDDQVVIYLCLWNSFIQKPVTLTLRLYDPQENLHRTWTFLYANPNPDTQCTYRTASIATEELSHLPGEWVVKAYVKDKQIGSKTLKLVVSESTVAQQRHPTKRYLVQKFDFLNSELSGRVKHRDIHFKRAFDASKDDQVVIYLCLYNDHLHKLVDVNLKLYTPQGNLHRTWTRSYTIYDSSTSCTYKIFSEAIRSISHLPGEWVAKAYVDDSLIGSERFTLVVPSGTVVQKPQRPQHMPHPTTTAPATPSAPKKTLTLTVQAMPADSAIKIMNIRPKYHPGIQLEPGPYLIQVEKDGYQTLNRWVTIRDTDVDMALTLEPEVRQYKLLLLAHPADSTVRLLNSSIPYRLGMELPPGQYDLLVEHSDYQAAQRSVTIHDQDVVLEVSLAPLPMATLPKEVPGLSQTSKEENVVQPTSEAKPTSAPSATYKLIVHAVPEDSSIQLLNTEEPYQLGIALPAGRYDLSVKRQGYKSVRQWVTIRDHDVSLEVALEKIP